MKIILLTYAFNAEKVLSRAIKSILVQEFCGYSPVYVLIDNGSNDQTNEIIGYYASQYNWIIPIHNNENERDILKKSVKTILENYQDADYFIELDADDEYSPDFIKKTLMFMESNNLDIACCGSQFINSATGLLVGRKSISHDLILTNGTYGDMFPIYHQFMRTVWGKIFKFSLLKENAFLDYEDLIVNGSDTAFTIGAFRRANRIGICKEVLHKYYISQNSVSYQFHPKRIESDRLLNKVTHSFLIEKDGYINSKNEYFLQMVYFNAVKDSLNVIVNSNLRSLKKLKYIQDLFCDRNIVLEWSYYEDFGYNELIHSLNIWIVRQPICRKKSGAELAAGIMLSINIGWAQLISKESLEFTITKLPDVIEYLANKDYDILLGRLRLWHKKNTMDNPAIIEIILAVYNIMEKPSDEIFKLLLRIKKDLPLTSERINIDKLICEFLSQYPLFNEISSQLASIFGDIILLTLKHDYKQAFNNFILLSQDLEIADSDYENYLRLGINLSAYVEDMDFYIYFNKLLISYLIDNLYIELADSKLSEFEKILPGDEELILLRSQITHSKLTGH